MWKSPLENQQKIFVLVIKTESNLLNKKQLQHKLKIEKTNSNLGGLGLAQTILLLKDLGVLLQILLDILQQNRNKIHSVVSGMK